MFAITLRIFAVACAGAALTHALMGVSGDGVIGAPLASPINPSLDSQNRFYGAAFGLNAVLLWLSAMDVARYASVLRAILVVMFVAGCMRGLAVIAHGWPSVQVMFLWSTEVLIPPVMWVWLNAVLRGAGR